MDDKQQLFVFLNFKNTVTVSRLIDIKSKPVG